MMSQPVNVLVAGCGAVGTMCAYALHKSGAAKVTAILRSNFQVVEAQGFDIQSVDHDEVRGWKPDYLVERTVDDACKHGPFDYVVVAMKNLPDIYSIPDIIRPSITLEHTSIVLVQNGIGIEATFLEAFPENTLLSGVPMIGCEQDGHKILHNDPDLLFLSPFSSPSSNPSRDESSCRRFSELYELGGAKCPRPENITWSRWRKLVWNASFNTVCALLNLDSGAVQDAGCTDTLIRPAMDEVVAIAKAAGHLLPADIQSQMIAFTPKELYLRPSMQVDAMRRRPMEIEVILGEPLRVAREHKVHAPTLSTLYNLLKAKQWEFKSQGGSN
ncbi:2-dehydropantoate 2-reductase family [Thozetella sp. PMI_491]|nr:2-dehydropantoate 2-reductase family [Thozetella sp. PMI_491]